MRIVGNAMAAVAIVVLIVVAGGGWLGKRLLGQAAAPVVWKAMATPSRSMLRGKDGERSRGRPRAKGGSILQTP